jgi:hypothetical protein
MSRPSARAPVAFKLYCELGSSRTHDGVAFRLGIPLGTVRGWAFRYHWSARIPPEPAPTAQKPPTGRASDWLEAFLSKGPKSVSKIREAALAARFTWMAIRHAAEMLMVEEPRASVWALPAFDGSPRRVSDALSGGALHPGRAAPGLLGTEVREQVLRVV